MSIKCYHCKGNHELVSQVKDCAKVPAAFAAKVEIGKIVETVVPGTVGMTFTNGAAIIAAGGLKGIIEAKKEAKKAAVPAHRLDPKYLALKAKIVTPEQKAAVQEIAKAAADVVFGPASTEVKKGQDLELGMYQITDANGIQMVYKIKWNKTNTYKYAEKLVITDGKWTKTGKPSGKFIYAGSMMNKLTSENKMTAEQAKAFHDSTKEKYGQTYGFCCVCGKLLTVKKSVDAGIGPVCAGKL